jgi:pimeloyl-ACP methyl ester carboxylesterase
MTTRLRFQEAGRGPAVLWIHGYTMDSSVWAELWERLPGWRTSAWTCPATASLRRWSLA